MNDHADVVRRQTEVVLGFPNLAAADRSELQNVLREVDDAVRIFGPETESPAVLRLFAQHAHPDPTNAHHREQIHQAGQLNPLWRHSPNRASRLRDSPHANLRCRNSS